jgi:hypothetical protein
MTPEQTQSPQTHHFGWLPLQSPNYDRDVPRCTCRLHERMNVYSRFFGMFRNGVNGQLFGARYGFILDLIGTIPLLALLH